MNCVTILADIAGRLSLDTSGGAFVTAAAVGIASSDEQTLSSQLSSTFPKWQSCDQAAAEFVTRLIAAQKVTIAAINMDKNTAAWGRFWKDVGPLQAAIVAQSRAAAGFVKPANILAFDLIGTASAIASAEAIRIYGPGHVLSRHGRRLIERTVVCDTDIKGKENLEMFRSLWARHDLRQPRMNSLGYQFVTRDVRVATEQEEPLLLLADYVAGIVHTALMGDPGRIPPPLPSATSKNLMGLLTNAGKLVVHKTQFNLTYDEIFGDLMVLARNARRGHRSVR
jgi:hypothetical protein